MAPAAGPLLASAMSATATGSRPFDSEGVVVGTTQHSGGTVSSKGRGGETVILSHPSSLVEVPNPYGGTPVELQPEVVSTDGNLVLFMRRSPHGAIPNDFFVCSGQDGDPVWLPPLPGEVLLPGSMGLLDCSNDCYLVAHLSVTHNQNTGLITQGTLHLWKSSPKNEASTPESVILPLPNLTSWHAYRVIPFNYGTHQILMWVDLNQGILCMSLSDDKPASFKFVDLPKELSSMETKPWRNDRPDMFRSVGCCNGKLSPLDKLKLVNLHIPRRSTTNAVAVDIWTLDLENGNWSEDYNNVSLNCGNQWESYNRKLRPNRTTPLPPWPNSVPISPFLREDNSTILYLTVVEQKNKNKKAWLLQIDMQTITLKDVTEYPNYYYSHMKQPFLINSSSSITPRAQ